MKTFSDIRPSPIAGTWYSANREKLAQSVDAFIQQADLPSMGGDVLAVIAPHAGHVYSGRTAGYAFRCVKGMEPEIVVVVSPFHNYYPAPLITTAHNAYFTPLGEIPVDTEAVNGLKALLLQSRLELVALANDSEHSLEIELPFLQRALAAPFKLLPIMLRSQTSELAHILGISLARVVKDRKVLLVASTDLSHFQPQAVANRLDKNMLDQIEAFSPEGVLEAEENGTGLACGAYAVAAVLWAARELGANSAHVLHHSTSADQTGDTTSVVGYGAAVVLKKP